MRAGGNEAWTDVAAESFCDSVRDGTHDSPKFVDDGHPLITSKNIRNGRVILETANLISEQDFSDINRRSKVDQWDVLFSMIGTVGEVCLVREEEPPFAIKNIGLFKVGDELKAKWLYYWLCSPMTQAAIRQACRGASQQYIPLGELREFPVRVLTKPRVTRKIANILSAYDDLVENNRRRIALLEEAARLLYREWFVHFRFPGHEHVKIIDGLPEGWQRRRLGDVVKVVKLAVRPSKFEEHDIHIGLAHIPRRSFTLADWEPAEGLASGKWRFEEGDILFCKIRPYFHKVGFTMRRGLVSSDALVWRVHDEADWPVVLCATSSDHFVAVASKTVREGSKMPRADWKVLQEYVIQEPPRGLLDIFNDTVQKIATQCKTLALQNRALARARDLLLPRLMNGEIAV